MDTVESVKGLILRVVAALDRVDIPYMVTGSLASSFHGEPRSTNDIDFVIDPDRQSLDSLLGQFPSDAYYCDQENALSALQNRGMFNVVDLDTGWKVDFIIRKDRSFSRVEFERRQTDELFGVRICVASPEDVILAKLEWAKMSESERQIRDAAGVLRIMQHEIDADYLDSWIAELGVVRQWEQAKSLAGSHR